MEKKLLDADNLGAMPGATVGRLFPGKNMEQLMILVGFDWVAVKELNLSYYKGYI